MEVSAHAGARNKGTGPANHAEWQGKVYSISGKDSKYPPLIETTGYGTATGLLGINCRHSLFIFFEGVSTPEYTQAELDRINNTKVNYDGQQMDLYEATQKQRYIERQIRDWKRKAGALNAGGLDNTEERLKVGQWQAKARDFTKQTGLVRRYEWEQAAGMNVRGLTRKPEVNIAQPPSSGRQLNTQNMPVKREAQIVGHIGETIKPIFEGRTSATVVRVTTDVFEHIYKHKDEFDIIRAIDMLPGILSNPKYIYQGKKATSVQFVENFTERYFLLVPVKFLPEELWLETITIEEKARFLRRWAKRVRLYERK